MLVQEQQGFEVGYRKEPTGIDAGCKEGRGNKYMCQSVRLIRVT
jgi:hypothetical protein